jgi:hypothetical protein
MGALGRGGRAAQSGVLVRDGDALACLANVKTICFDKTGTLTTGDAAVEAVYYDAGADERVLLSVASALSRSSNHPLAAAIGRYADARLTKCSAVVQHALVRPAVELPARALTWPRSLFLVAARGWPSADNEHPANGSGPKVPWTMPLLKHSCVGWTGSRTFYVSRGSPTRSGSNHYALRRLGLTA